MRWAGMYVVRGSGFEVPTVGPICVASVHAIAREVDHPSVSDADHMRIKRSGCDRAWNNDLAASALHGWVGDSTFLVGGDWNTARHFDAAYGRRWPNAGREFFDNAVRRGWCESLRKYHSDEIRTYLDAASAPYELDHLFTSPKLDSQLVKCDVDASANVAEMSDHAVVVADFEVTS